MRNFDQPGKSVAIGTNGMAATSSPLATLAAIDAWDQLLKQEGTMTLGEALKPAIKLAEKGVPTTPRVAHDWPESEAMLAADEGGAKHYLKNGRSPREGEIMAYPALAKTLKT